MKLLNKKTVKIGVLSILFSGSYIFWAFLAPVIGYQMNSPLVKQAANAIVASVGADNEDCLNIASAECPIHSEYWSSIGHVDWQSTIDDLLGNHYHVYSTQDHDTTQSNQWHQDGHDSFWSNSWESDNHAYAQSSNWNTDGHGYTTSSQWLRDNHDYDLSRSYPAGHLYDFSRFFPDHSVANSNRLQLFHLYSWTRTGHVTETSWNDQGHALATTNNWVQIDHWYEISQAWILNGHAMNLSRQWEQLGHDYGITQNWIRAGHNLARSQLWQQNGHQITRSLLGIPNRVREPALGAIALEDK